MPIEPLPEGADAVVLRSHEAAYEARGSRQPRSPTWLSLRGLAVRLDRTARNCELAVIDPADFAREALEKDRQHLSVDTGVSF